MKQVCKELIDFFEQGEGWNKDDVLSELAETTLSNLNCTTKPNNLPVSMNEIELRHSENKLSITLEDFAHEFFDEVIKGVCNVIRTA